MIENLKFSQFNECSILIEWPAIIDDFILKEVLNFKNVIQNKCVEDIVEVVAAYNSILIIYMSTIDNVNDRFEELKSHFLSVNNTEVLKTSIWEIPVCYDDKFGIDLESFSNQKELTKAEVIKLHSGVIYTVYFIGFLPGFLYLGGLNSKLFLDRKTTPNLNVKKGSIAIGGQQTGIYPQDSPGGWHIIGNSPIELFNAKQNPPCFIKAGDKVKFVSISKSEYECIEIDIKQSKYQLNSIDIDA